MHATRHDPANVKTLAAAAHLEAARHAREQYASILRHAIEVYGDRHVPVKLGSGVYSVCEVCRAHGMIPTEDECLNHQTGSVISGIYSDHFPTTMKQSLRIYARLIGEHTGLAIECWRQAGRRFDTLRPLMEQSRQLADGNRSYY